MHVKSFKQAQSISSFTFLFVVFSWLQWLLFFMISCYLFAAYKKCLPNNETTKVIVNLHNRIKNRVYERESQIISKQLARYAPKEENYFARRSKEMNEKKPGIITISKFGSLTSARLLLNCVQQFVAIRLVCGVRCAVCYVLHRAQTRIVRSVYTEPNRTELNGTIIFRWQCECENILSSC